MKQSRDRVIPVLVFCLAFLLFLVFDVAPASSSSDLVGEWTETSSLPYPVASHSGLSLNGKIYVIAGANTIVTPFSVFSDSLNGGLLSNWTASSSSPRVYWHSTVQGGNNVYMLGGATYPPETILNSTYLANIMPDGHISGWAPLISLPMISARGGSVLVNNKIYYMGGFSTSSQTPSSDIVYMSEIGGGGSLGAWVEAGQMPEALEGFGLIESNGHLVIIGGRGANGETDKVWWAPIEPDGSVGAWLQLPSLPVPLTRSAIAMVGNVVVAAGGIGAADNWRAVYFATVNPDGSLGTWSRSSQDLPRGNCCSPLAVWNDYVYVTGGHDGIGYFDTVYVAKIYTVIANPSPTPLPAATPTPTLTPTPIPAIVDTVVLVPGMGASWNSDALLNCKDTGYSGGWSMAPFARGVYQPLIDAMNNGGIQVQEFYYDWRKDVRQNGMVLGDFLSVGLDAGEKAHLVGHSMGGLVGRAYIEQVGQPLLERAVTAGSPHQGTVLAYPAWSAGEFWEGDLLINIASSIALRRCGVLNNPRQTIEAHYPSIQNLLPVFDFLRDQMTRSIKPVASMADKNNWLPTGFTAPFKGVAIRTITGTGKRTLLELLVKDPTRNDVRAGNWEDGRPTNRTKIPDGDGTVLVTSGQLAGADNRILAGSHSGIITSQNGIALVTNFLGLGAPTIVSEFREPQSAIVILGEGSLESEGQLGEDVLVIYDPKFGRHMWHFKPKRSKSRVDVGQFTADGAVQWQEYDFVGLGGGGKTVEFGP